MVAEQEPYGDAAPDGRGLVVGGAAALRQRAPESTSELYDPSAGYLVADAPDR